MTHPTEAPLASVALVASALIAACGAGKGDAPALEQVRFADPQTLRLVFADAVVVGDADPGAFRLSLGVRDEGSTIYYALDYDGLAVDTDGPVSDSDPSAASASASMTGGDDGDYGTTYVDPSADDGYDTGYDPSADGGYDDGGYATPAGADAFARPIPALPIADLAISGVCPVESDAAQVDLVLVGSVADTPACTALAEFQADGGKAGIFLHHRSDARSIESRGGPRLGDIGSHWVEASAQAYAEVSGDFAQLDPYLPIPCP